MSLLATGDTFWRSPVAPLTFPNSSAMPAADLSAEHLNTAAHLLGAWEQGRPVGASRVEPTVRDAFAALVAETLADDEGVNVDQEDIRHVLDGATGLGIGRGGSSGPHRAQQALADAWRQWQAVDWCPAGQGRILLFVLSHEEHDLEMDELTVISEALQQATGPEWEMVFGHGVVPDQAAELCLGFLLAPRALPEEMAWHSTLRLAMLPPR